MNERDHTAAQLDQMKHLWLDLADALEQSHGALLRGDVARFEEQINRQQRCCAELRCLDGTVENPDRGRSLLEDIEGIQKRVRHLNRVHAALLRRACRSLVIARNLLAASHASYTPMALPQTLIYSREE